MWSSPLELYPVHVSSTVAPHGQVYVKEPQVVRPLDYTIVQPPRGPYEVITYSKKLWIC